MNQSAVSELKVVIKQQFCNEPITFGSLGGILVLAHEELEILHSILDPPFQAAVQLDVFASTIPYRGGGALPLLCPFDDDAFLLDQLRPLGIVRTDERQELFG